MATLVASIKAPPAEAPRKPSNLRKTLVALFGVMVGVGLLALCLISAQQLLIARQTPFGVVGPSTVVQGAQTKVGLDPVFYPSKSAALAAIDQGQLYGGFIRASTPGAPSTLITVPTASDLAPGTCRCSSAAQPRPCTCHSRSSPTHQSSCPRRTRSGSCHHSCCSRC